MKQHNYFQVLKNRDTTEGRGPMMSTGIGFATESEALKFVTGEVYAKRFGVQGTPGSEHCIEETTLFVYDHADEYVSMAEVVDKEKRRRAALKKLSTEERELLGLGDLDGNPH